MSSTTTPNMGLIVPTVANEPGPTFASDVNSSLTLIDNHNHSPGFGVPITPAGLSINTALPFGGNPATTLSYVSYTAQTSVTQTQATYVKGVDLYYRDGSNNEIQITTGGSVNGSSGTITGLPNGTAGVNYASSVFTFSAATNTPANVQMGSVLLGNNTALSKYLTLQPPNAMAANYSLTLPTVPASQKIMTLDNSGTMSAPYTVDNSTITISANVIGVPAGGIGSTQIATNGVATSNIAAGAVTPVKITPTIAQATMNVASITVSPTTTNGATAVTIAARLVQVTLYSGSISIIDGSGSGGTCTMVVSRWDGAVHTTIGTLMQYTGNLGGTYTHYFGNAVIDGTLNNNTGACIFFDTPGAGTTRYDIITSFTGVTGHAAITNAIMSVQVI